MTFHDGQTPAPGNAGEHAALVPWGWQRYTSSGAVESRPGLAVARVIGHQHYQYDLVCSPDARSHRSRVSGAFAYRAVGPVDYPTVGDWVFIDPESGTIQAVLPRRTAISRKVAGEETLEQVIVANIDTVLLVFAMDGARGFTVGLVERATTAAWNSGARPIVILNKTDLADAAERERIVLDTATAAPGVDVFQVSARTGEGIADLLAALSPDETVGMLGKSGVGKSALLNAIGRVRGAEMAVREGELRHGDLQGRHTTTDKHLYLLPGGPIVADVPGLRELQLWAEEDSLDGTFPEIEALSRECRFNDCSHNGEPGCRIQEALASGELPVERYDRYLDLQRELAHLNRRRDQRAREEEQMKWKKIAKQIREIEKRRRP